MLATRVHMLLPTFMVEICYLLGCLQSAALNRLEHRQTHIHHSGSGGERAYGKLSTWCEHQNEAAYFGGGHCRKQGLFLRYAELFFWRPSTAFCVTLVTTRSWQARMSRIIEWRKQCTRRTEIAKATHSFKTHIDQIGGSCVRNLPCSKHSFCVGSHFPNFPFILSLSHQEDEEEEEEETLLHHPGPPLFHFPLINTLLCWWTVPNLYALLLSSLAVSDLAF